MADTELLSIPEALEDVKSALAERNAAKERSAAAQRRFIEAGRRARRSGVPIRQIAQEVGLGRQQAHRLFGRSDG